MSIEYPIHKSSRFKDISGATFGKIKVIAYAGASEISNSSRWECVCLACGKMSVKNTGAIKLSKPLGKRGCVCHKEGHRSQPEYAVWKSMNSRCYDDKEKRYGGRGITVCERWKNSFASFLADMGPRPSPKHSIDRINNDGNYEPANFRWATKVQQNRNRRSNRILEANGVSMTLVEWAQKTGIRRDTIAARIKRGWPVADALGL